MRSDLELSPDEYFMVNGGYQLFDRDVDYDALAYVMTISPTVIETEIVVRVASTRSGFTLA